MARKCCYLLCCCNLLLLLEIDHYHSLAEERLILEMLLQEPGVWFAFGCHPRNAVEFTPEHKSGLCKLLKITPNVVALGEIGLDYAGG